MGDIKGRVNLVCPDCPPLKIYCVRAWFTTLQALEEYIREVKRLARGKICMAFIFCIIQNSLNVYLKCIAN